MAENTDNTTAPEAGAAPAPSTSAPAPASEPAGEGGGWKAEILTKPELKEIPRETEGPAPKDKGGDDDTGGGYVASSGGASYASDVAMMRAEVSYTDSTVIPHLELLVSQAETAGNGPKTIQAVRAALDAARTALGTSQDAIRDVQATSEPVQNAYDDAGGEAAKSKAYFHGD